MFKFGIGKASLIGTRTRANGRSTDENIFLVEEHTQNRFSRQKF